MDIRNVRSLPPTMMCISTSSITRSRALALVQRVHDGIETQVLNEVLTLDEAYRIYFKEWQREVALQRIAAAKLWPLTRDLSVRPDIMCRCPQPRNGTEIEALMSNYQLHYKIILGSNMSMIVGLSAVRKHLLSLRREYAGLDLATGTPFIVGDQFHKPIKFFMDLVEELFKYFHSHYLQLDCGAHHLDPYDLSSVEKYQKMLEPSEEFNEYLLQNLSYCQYLKPSDPCPVISTPPTLSTDLAEAQQRAIHSRCRRRLMRMGQRRYSRETSSIEGELPTNDPLDPEHEFRMNQLSTRLAELHEHNSSASRRDVVNEMIYNLSPSLMPPTFHGFRPDSVPVP